MTWLLNLLTGGLFNSISTTINNITAAISNQKIAQINATSDVEKAKIQANIDQLQAQREVLIANDKSGLGWVDEALRVGFALPFVVYFNKILIWDKVIGSWPNYSTDALSTNDFYALCAILGYLFVSLLKK